MTHPTELKRSQRRGVSLVSILVVIAIVAVLLGIILPAVQSARSTARRVECANKLKQLGIAVDTYLTAKRHYPSGNLKGHNPQVQILPYLDQSALYDQVDFSIEPYLVPAQTELLRANRPSAFLCPAQTAAEKVRAAGNYVTNVGTSYVDPAHASSFPADVVDNGAFERTYTPPLNPSDFPDGLSNTVFWSEMAWIDRDGSALVKGLQLPDANSLEEWHSRVQDCLAATDADDFRDGPSLWYLPGLGSSAYTHILPPNGNSCYIGAAQLSVYTASSNHSGGVNVVFGDGRVQLVADGIDLGVWRAVGTRNRSEVFDSF